MSPFKSEKQRRWMHANEPEMAAEWEAEERRKRVRSKKSKKRKNKKKKGGVV